MNVIGYTQIKLNAQKQIVFEKVIDKDGNVEIQTPEQNGYKKEIEITVIFSRSAYDDHDLLLKTGYFKQVLTVSIEDTKANRYAYLFFDKKVMKTVCLRNLDPEADFTYTISLSEPKNKIEASVRLYEVKRGKAERISEETANQLRIDKEALLYDGETLDSNTVWKKVLE